MFSDRLALRLHDVIDNAGAAIDYVKGMSLTDYTADRKTRDAVERCVERVTEALVRIGEPILAELMPDLPLYKARGLGNALRHNYDRIDPAVILTTVNDDFPPLRAACEALLRQHDA